MDNAAEARAFLARLDSQARRSTLTTHLGHVVARDWGDGPVLVLLHGGTGSWRHWARNIAPLANDCRVVALDLPGMGDSDLPAVAVDRPAIAAAVREAIITMLPGEVFHLAGFSFGGSIAGLLAGLAPRHVRSLTLVGPGGFGPPMASPPRQRLRHLAGEARIAAHRANLLNLMIAEPEHVDALAIEIQEQNTRQSRLGILTDRTHPYLPAAFAEFAGPLNAVWGERDHFISAHLRDRIAGLRAARPDARVQVFSGAGHWVAYEAAGHFTAWLRAHLPANAPVVRR
ncbi:MAG: alpha/beta fold hydrolase [Rhodospirillales bacterium]|nr:alpha/beta fold hydrolase [Rhodospirillales bacterium]